jgi:hypothetical protein
MAQHQIVFMDSSKIGGWPTIEPEEGFFERPIIAALQGWRRWNVSLTSPRREGKAAY